jgi:peptidyl-prolyl cis-trans isomerase SurA
MIHTRIAFAAAVLTALSCSPACRRGETAPPPVPADVAAVVDGTSIPQAEVDKTYRLMFQAPPAGTSASAEVLTQKLSALEELINQEILLTRARAAGLQASDAEVEAAFTDRKGGMPEDAYQKQLTDRGLTSDDIRRGIRRELTIQKLLDRDVVSKIAITDEDVAAFYNDNRAQFNLTEPSYRVAEIVVTPERNPDVRNRLNDDAGSAAEVKSKVDMLLGKLRAGTDFGALAMDYSEDPQSAPQGGEVGVITQSGLYQAPLALKNVILQTQPGNISVATVGGTSIVVLVVAREAAGQRDLNSPGVKDTIRDLLHDRREQLLRSAYMASVRNEAKVQNALAKRIVDSQGKAPGLPMSAPGK